MKSNIGRIEEIELTYESIEKFAGRYDANVQVIDIEENRFSLEKTFDVDEYFDFAEVEDGKWLDRSEDNMILCNEEYHVVSVVNFKGFKPVSASYYFSDRYGTVDDGQEDNAIAVLDFWKSKGE